MIEKKLRIMLHGGFPGGPVVEAHTPQSLWSTREATAKRSLYSTAKEESPLAATREKPSHSKKDPVQPKIK